MKTNEQTLAKRLGMISHVSSLRFKVEALAKRYPSQRANTFEDWLVDVANTRGARIVFRPNSNISTFTPPATGELSNEELVVAICLLQCYDRPQMLRLAAQLISQKQINGAKLRLTAERERTGMILAELARQALRIEPDHDLWKTILIYFGHLKRPRSPLLHWTRLAQPLMNNGRCNANTWKLVA